jgi:hypothetical protein
MKRSITLLVTTILALAIATPVFAHVPMRVVGVVMSREKDQITVKTSEGKTVSIYIPKDTKVTGDNKPVDPTQVKIKATVVIDGIGDSEEDLVAFEVRLVPPISAKKK